MLYVSGWNRPDHLPEADTVLEWETLDEAKAHLLLAVATFSLEDYLHDVDYERWMPVKEAIMGATGVPWQTSVSDNSMIFWIIDSRELT